MCGCVIIVVVKVLILCLKMVDYLSEGNTSNTSCNSSDGMHDAVFIIKLSTSSLSCLTNFLAVLIIVCGGSYKKLIIRSVLYLLVANFLLVTVQVLELMPISYGNEHVHVKKGWQNVCRIFGFLDQDTAWMRDLVVVFIVIQLFIVTKNPAIFRRPQSVKSKIAEAISICLCFLLPFTFNWIPFLNDYYGLSGHWCWIKLVAKDCSDTDVMEGLLYMLVLYYCPLLVIVLLTSLLCLYMLCKWCTNTNEHSTIIFVILYPLIFDALCLIMFANRVVSALRIKNDASPVYSLWVLHALADSGRTLLPSVSVIVFLSCSTTRRLLMPRCCVRDNGERKPLVHPEEDAN